MSIVAGVYKITLLTDNRIYIGSSANISLRWQWHCNNSQQLISKMIKKYGRELFLFEIVEEVEPIREKLLEREQYYLDTLQPFPWNNKCGFNLSPTAYSVLGVTRSAKTRQKMKDSWHKSRGELYYKQLSERVSGNKNPACRPEVRQKISQAMTGKTWKNDVERVEKHRNQRTGCKFTDTAKANMKIAQQKNNTRSNEAKEKFYLAQRRLYLITTPENTQFEIYSRELKIFCKSHNLSYANLITTATTGKFYKKGWLAQLI
jgi:group I intron endonuclease